MILPIIYKKLNEVIENAKQKYLVRISKKLNNPATSSKCHWSLLLLLNGKKITCIHPTFHNNRYIADFKERGELSDSFFPGQCSPVCNGSNLPSHLTFLTKNRLILSQFLNDDIVKIINPLVPGVH